MGCWFRGWWRDDVALLCVVGEVSEIGLGRDCVVRMSVCMCAYVGGWSFPDQ